MDYGVTKRTVSETQFDLHLEEFGRLGFTIIPDVHSPTTLDHYRKALDAVYEVQKKELGEDFLASIQEKDSARALFCYDEIFLDLLLHPDLIGLVQAVLGEQFILQLQNGIINRPGSQHHQSSWHRDLPYQDWVISHPIACNLFHCVDDFTAETGATNFLAHSHRNAEMPSQEFVAANKISGLAKAGSVILFDSMVYHCSGQNTSNRVRRGINHLYTVPIIKQQIDLPRMLAGKYSDHPKLFRLLGYESEVPVSVVDWRQRRLKRKNRRSQNV